MSTQTTADPQVLVPTSTERVQFRDGQLVDADALTTAMMFPVSLLQVVLRSYLGCGIVCGLEVVRPDEERACVRIRPGVMVDCHGFPVELCREVVLDLTPDPCACETEPRELCILMRRATSEDASRRPCAGGCGGGCSGGCSGGCGCSGGAHDDCNRVRDQVLIKAVDLTALDDARDHVCETTVDDAEDDAKDDSGSRGSGTPVANAVAATAAVGADADADCACLTACAERCCAERSWVLLACVTVIPAPDDGYSVRVHAERGRLHASQVRQADRVLPVAPSRDRTQDGRDDRHDGDSGSGSGSGSVDGGEGGGHEDGGHEDGGHEDGGHEDGGHEGGSGSVEDGGHEGWLLTSMAVTRQRVQRPGARPRAPVVGRVAPPGLRPRCRPTCSSGWATGGRPGSWPARRVTGACRSFPCRRWLRRPSRRRRSPSAVPRPRPRSSLLPG